MDTEVPWKITRAATDVQGTFDMAGIVFDMKLKYERKYDRERGLLALRVVDEGTVVEFQVQEDDSVDTLVRGDGKFAPAAAAVLGVQQFDSNGCEVPGPHAVESKKKRQLWSDLFDKCFDEHRDPPSSWDSIPPDQRLAVSIAVFYCQICRNGPADAWWR